MKKSLRLSWASLVALALSVCLTAFAVGGQPVRQQALRAEPEQQDAKEAAEIRAVLDAQVAAWNAGRLEEFMAGYWRSPKLTFFSGGSRQQGWDATLARYRKVYQSEGREMGRLAFSDLDIQLLAKDAALVRGHWELTFSDGKKLGGLYTLVFRRLKEGWKITHDHSSATQ